MTLTQKIQILKAQFIDKVPLSSSMDAASTHFFLCVHFREIYCSHHGDKAPLTVLM